MEGTNSFEKGLHRSNSPQMQPEGSYVDAYNWIRNDSGRLVNEELEQEMQSLKDAGSYKYLGSCPIQDSFIIFFQQIGTDGKLYSEVGMFDNLTKEYTKIFNDSLVSYRLNFNKNIDSVARIVANGDIIVYFVEENNKPRRFNITEFKKLGYDSDIYNTVEDWNLQLSFKMPYANYAVDAGGSLPTGTYSFAFRYATDQNNKTTFNVPSRFINIVPSATQNSALIYNDKVTGAIPQDDSDQRIIINLQNLDENYPFIEVVVITYLGLTNALSIKSLGLFENRENLQVIFNNSSQYLQDISESALLEIPVNIDSATSIEQKDNILVLSNITSKKFDVGFQEIANNIKLFWKTEKLSVDNKRNISGIRNSLFNGLDWTYTAAGTGNLTQDGRLYGSINNGTANGTSVDANDSKSNVYADPLILKGFQRGEVYSFSFTPIYKDGSIGFAYHIPGNIDPTVGNALKPCLKPWNSEETYTQAYQDAGLSGPIRHHQMPDYDETQYIGNEFEIVKLSVEASFTKIFTDEQKDNIQGYIIGFQPRNNEQNTRIIDNGFTRPYLVNERNNNQYTTSLWTGSVLHVESAGNANPETNRSSYTWSPNWSINNTYAMYHSPDTLLDSTKIKGGYKIQRVGYGLNVILHKYILGDLTFFFESPITDYAYLTLPICTNRSPDPTSSNLFFNAFFEFNGFESNKGGIASIEDAQYVPNVGSENTTIIDGKITVNYCSQYIHLKTSFSHFFDNASFAQRKYFLDNQYIVNQIEGTSVGDGFFIFNPARHKNEQNDFTQRIGINMVRIINDNPNQYGKLENAEYTPAVVVLGDTLPTDTTLEGDIYISKYFFNFSDRVKARTSEEVSGNSMMGIYVESKNNFSLRHTEEGKVPFYPNYKRFVDTNAANLGIFNFEWWKVTTGYNKQYSSITGLKLSFPKPLFFNEVVNYSNRSIYSSQSFESELVDQYRSFPSLNFHDIPKHRGVITDTFVFSNNFYHHTEYGLWLSYFNPNTTQATSQGQVVLGNAGIFQLPSKLILDIKGGYMGTLDKSGTNTPFGRVFLDHKQGKVFLFAGDAPLEISDLGLFSFFREFVNTNDKYSMGYDWANKRLLLNNITQEKAISFYPKTQTWTSFHDFSPLAYFTTNGYSYAYKESFFRGAGFVGTFYNLDNVIGLRKKSYITFVENTSPDNFKRFDRMELNTMSGGKETTGSNLNYLISPGSVENDNYKFLNKSFSSIHCWTDRQNSTNLPLAYSDSYEDNFLNGYDVDKVPVNYYRSSFHLELPLDAVVDPYKNIFNSTNLNINADFRAHMKGKFLYTKLSYNDNNPLVLNYIKTFFKPTVA
jgi:hypothetical protein